VPSPQLVGSAERRTLDLNALIDQGVEVVGRLVGVDGSRLFFSGSLANYCTMADLKLNRLLERIDRWVDERRSVAVSPPQRFAATRLDSAPRLTIDVAKVPLATVIWATGFRPDYSWVELPVFDGKGRLRHDGGVISTAGLYTLGGSFLRRRKSSYIHGAEDDVRDLSAHLVQHLRGAQLGAARRIR
jgi:putative flavoprotein involved in K+ transport